MNQIVLRCIIFKLRSPRPNPETLAVLLQNLRQIPHTFSKLENTTPLSLHFTSKSEHHLEKSGGLNESTQHSLEVYLRESKKLKSLAGVNFSDGLQRGSRCIPGLVELSDSEFYFFASSAASSSSRVAATDTLSTPKTSITSGDPGSTPQ